jgi:hypothetical protein
MEDDCIKGLGQYGGFLNSCVGSIVFSRNFWLAQMVDSVFHQGRNTVLLTQQVLFVFFDDLLETYLYLDKHRLRETVRIQFRFFMSRGSLIIAVYFSPIVAGWLIVSGYFSIK